MDDESKAGGLYNYSGGVRGADKRDTLQHSLLWTCR